jgi:pimeloyl-ACP methyl ester carboxylesterase
MHPPVLYARSGDIHIAYSVLGSGEVDMVWTPGSVSHLEAVWDHPRFMADCVARVSAFARVILFDKRGTGMSDRPAGIPTLEERIDDIRAVMDATQSERAHLFGLSEGGSMACLFAATYPQRTRSLLLWGTRPRWTRTPDYPWGDTQDEVEQNLQSQIANGWRQDMNTPAMRRWLGPEYRDDPEFLAWFRRYRQVSASPSARIALARMNGLVDIRDILPTIRVPTLVLGKTEDPVMPRACAEDLVARVPGARLVLFPGEGHLIGDALDDLVQTIREWVTEATAPVASDRFLATVLFVDLVRSTERVAEVGDSAWRELLQRYYVLARRELGIFGGVEVDTSGDGLLAHFDGPGRAIRCARGIERAAAQLGLEARAGVHTGEVERDSAAIRGLAVHLAARIASLAGGGEVLVSSTVRDLVAGSGLSFVDRGMHALKGIREQRQVLAVSA